MYKISQPLFFVLATVVIFVLLGIRWWPQPAAGFRVAPLTTSPDTPIYHEQFVSFGETTAVHAPALALRHDGRLIATWYAGSREGAKDVEISSTIIDPSNYTLSPSRPVATRTQTEQHSWRYIRKLGNPVIHQLRDGRLMLIYVSVSVGGWAASSLNLRFSSDGGHRWGKSRRLITSPFINISTLVRGAPFDFDNGDIGVPVYHEFMGKFSELLILDQHGKVKDKRRMSWGRDAIQPVIVPLTPKKAIALLRDSGEVNKRIGFTLSDDYGQRWATPLPLKLANPNAAISAVRTPADEVITVFNNHEDERNDLTLAISKDQGGSWKVIHQFEHEVLQPGIKTEFSYPYMIQDEVGNYHLIYTWHKKRIKYIHFNQAWLEAIQ